MNPPIPSSSPFVLAQFKRASVAQAGTVFAQIEDSSAANCGLCVVEPCELVGISVVVEGDIGNATRSYAAEVYVNRATGYTGDVATGISTLIQGTTGTDFIAYARTRGVFVQPGDIVTVYDKRSTDALNAQSAYVTVWARGVD